MPEYTIQRENQRCRVLIHGDLTATSLDGLPSALKAELSRGANELAFDLGRTEMLDSTGIGMLIATHNSLARAGGKMSVQNVSPQIVQLLQTMRLATRLNVSGRANS
jgi:anti-anti-sigma factor